MKAGISLSKYLNFGVILLAFLLPWQARFIFREGGVEWATLSLFATEVFVALLLALSFFDAAFRLRLRERLPRRIVFPAALLILFAFLSVAWAGDKDIALQKSTQLVLAFGAFGLFLGYEYPRRIGRAFIISMTIQVLLGLFQVAMAASPASTWLGIALHSASEGAASVVEAGPYRLLRAYGTLPHPNALGGFLAIAVILVFNDARSTFARASADRRATHDARRTLWLATLSLLLLGLFLTFSRSAWIAAVVGTIPLLVSLLRERNRAHFLLLLALVPTVIAALFFWPLVVGRATGQGRLETRSVNERVSSLSDGLARFRESPVLGTGVGQVLRPTPYALRPKQEPAHFLPLEVAAELGILGLLAFFALAWQLFRHALKSPLSLSLLLALSTVALFDHYLWTLWAGNLLAVLALSFLPSPIEIDKTPETS